MSTSMIDEPERALANALAIKDRDGRVALGVGLVVYVSVEDPWTRPVREAVASVADECIQRFREHLRWAKHPRTTKWHRIDNGRVKVPGEWLPGHTDGKYWEFGFHGGETAATASPFQITGYGADSRGRSTGFLRVCLPLLWFAENGGSLQEFTLAICERLEPISGYGGLGIFEALEGPTQRRYQPAVYEVAKRFPGLDMETVSLCWPLREGIKGVNWLTVLSDRWIGELGGAEALRASLDASFVFYPYGGGLMIQAGPRPQAGDAAANRWPQRYVALAKVLRPIYVKEVYGFHSFPGAECGDPAVCRTWVFRFDGK